jgi:hypothetical protein
MVNVAYEFVGAFFRMKTRRKSDVRHFNEKANYIG